MRLVWSILTILCSTLLAHPDSPRPPKSTPTKDHWAFKMPVSDGRSIDDLINANLLNANLDPAPQAERHILIRRVFHVLTGLLPSPDERQKWLTDPRPDWLAHLTKDLLSRPTFGERWARHWLDIARYADTRGAATPDNEDYPYAYTYRDWVIRAFNQSLPYDEFLHRQIAADLMDLPREELAALGFLTVGRAYQGGQNHLVIADRIDVATRSTMGLTVACARCHDHKTDPIPTADYYALYGVFNSSSVPKKLPVIAEPSQKPDAIAYRVELEKKARTVHQHVASCVPEYKIPEDLLNFTLPGKINNKINQTQRGKLRKLIGAVTKFQATSPHAVPRAMVLREKPQPYSPRIHERGNPGAKGDPVPRAFLGILRGEDEHFTEGSGRLEFAHRLTDDRNPLTARVWANRVWMHLSGTPLVDSPGDFGPQTAQPLQLPLLDHLAIFLQENEWSTKALVQHIITSQTWQRASLGSHPADPANLYYAHANRQRKDLEAWRDSALQVSGRLVPKIGGTPVHIDQSPYEGRRTIYGKIRRGFLPSLMRAFDFPGSEEAIMKRSTTITPTQALYLMNSPFLHGEARAIARHSTTIESIYQSILQRPPSTGEKQSAQEWLKRARQSRTAGSWEYGFLHQDSLEFKPLPHYHKGQWRGKSPLPDPTHGWLSWNAHGGHPENNRHAALKWTAIESGEISITGEINVPTKRGNGVITRVMQPKGEILGEWHISPGETGATEVKNLKVEAGSEVWFIVDSKGDSGFDSFKWAPVISDSNGTVADARADFSGPGLPPHAQLAQALLLSNEFFYID